MIIFAIGMSLLFLVIGLGLAKAKSFPRAGGWMVKVHKASSVVLALGGVYFLLRGFGAFQLRLARRIAESRRAPFSGLTFGARGPRRWCGRRFLRG